MRHGEKVFVKKVMEMRAEVAFEIRRLLGDYITLTASTDRIPPRKCM